MTKPPLTPMAAAPALLATALSVMAMSGGVSGTGIFRAGRFGCPKEPEGKNGDPYDYKKVQKAAAQGVGKRGDQHRSHGSAGGEQEEQVPIDGLAAYGAFGMSNGHRD